MRRYIGTKVIEATPGQGADGTTEGYDVHYADGYTSWSPKAPFEEAYRDIAEGVTFGDAIYFLKRGGVVTRRGWNGKGMFLYMVPPGEYPARTRAAKDYFGEDALVPYRAYIAMKTVDGDVVPWVASQSDVLAEDWLVITEGGNNG